MNRTADIEDLKVAEEDPELSKEGAETSAKLQEIVDKELLPIQGGVRSVSICVDFALLSQMSNDYHDPQ